MSNKLKIVIIVSNNINIIDDSLASSKKCEDENLRPEARLSSLCIVRSAKSISLEQYNTCPGKTFTPFRA